MLIDAVVDKAAELKTAPQVLTFEPHPRAVFQPDAAPFRLTPAPVKERLLKEIGITNIVVLPFTREFAQMSAQDFVDRTLIGQLNAKHVVAGHDFSFGRNREGTMKKLPDMLAPHGCGVTEITPLKDEKGEILSATRVREYLKQGATEKAAEILGRNWSVSGTVIKGAQRGRRIGVPTANIALGEYLRPLFGVYAVEAKRAGHENVYRGVANIGVRPTVDGQSQLLEAHLFDFNEDIYGQEWEFALAKFIRPEQKFDDFDALRAQIKLDIEIAKSA
jgi:riboflavin kinase/FMN adenylyltransferase